MESVISERGQVTIPKRVRDQLGLRPGQAIEFEVRDGILIGRKITVGADPVAAFSGILGRVDVDRALAESRGPRWTKKRDEDRG